MALFKDGKVYRTLEEQVGFLTKVKYNSYQKEEIDEIVEDLDEKINTKQDTLTFDNTPTEDSDNPVTSDGIYDALATKQNTLTFDATPTDNSNNPVTSNGIYDALATKQNTLTFDDDPTQYSNNPVKSGGIYTYGEGIRAVAEGKCKSFTISDVTNPSFNSNSASLSGITSFEDSAGNTIQTSSLKNGDIVLVIETDVPDRWWSSSDSKFYMLETAKVDLSNYQTKLTFDDSPTENSNNPVKSGGIYTALGDKQDKPSTAGNEGDVLTIGTGGVPTWKTPQSGGIVIEDKIFANISALFSYISTNFDKIIKYKLTTPSSIAITGAGLKFTTSGNSSYSENITLNSQLGIHLYPCSKYNSGNTITFGSKTSNNGYVFNTISNSSFALNTTNITASTGEAYLYKASSSGLANNVSTYSFKFYLTEAST